MRKPFQNSDLLSLYDNLHLYKYFDLADPPFRNWLSASHLWSYRNSAGVKKRRHPFQDGLCSTLFAFSLASPKMIPFLLITPELLEVLWAAFKRNVLYKVKSHDASCRLQEMVQLYTTPLIMVGQHERLRKHEIMLLARFFTEQADL